MRILLLILVQGLAVQALAWGQEFDRLDGGVLGQLIGSDAVKSHVRLDANELARVPPVLKGLRSAVLVVKTDMGNLCRLQVSPALRQPSDPASAPIPIFILERFETFEPGSEGKRTAQERQRLLFPGFQIDLDSGQVVPAGCGGDLAVQADDSAKPALAPVNNAGLYSLERNPFPAKGAAARPSSARQVQPTDFTGTYRLVANGQWSGDIELSVDDQGHARGRYRSDQTGTVYQVRGQTSRAPANQIELNVQFPRSELVLVGWLWTEGKAAFAGSAKLDDRPFGFVAIRQGEPLDAAGALVSTEKNRSGADLLLDIDAAGVLTRDQKPVDAAELRKALALVREQGVETPIVSLNIHANCTYDRLAMWLNALEETGPVDLRLGRDVAKPVSP